MASTNRYIHVPYLIKAGDTLSALAQRFLGDGHRYPEIYQINPWLKSPSEIRAGDTIMVPVLLTPNLLQSDALLEALKPHRADYPTNWATAKAIFYEVSTQYQPTWDRDVDIVAYARREGVIRLAQALGILDDVEAQEELDAVNKAFAG